MTTEQQLPEGWKKTTLGEIATYVNGRAFKPIEWSKTGIPIVRIQNLIIQMLNIITTMEILRKNIILEMEICFLHGLHHLEHIFGKVNMLS